MKCAICENEDKTVLNEGQICDPYWYGSRLDPKQWKKQLKQKGIEVERSIGCMPIPGGFACGNPYKKVPQKKFKEG